MRRVLRSGFILSHDRYDSTQPAKRRVRRPRQRWWRRLEAIGQRPGPEHPVPRDAGGRRRRLGGRDVTQTSRLVSQAGRKSQLLVEDQTISETNITILSATRLVPPRPLNIKIKPQLPVSPRMSWCVRVSVCVRLCTCACSRSESIQNAFFSVYVINKFFKKKDND